MIGVISDKLLKKENRKISHLISKITNVQMSLSMFSQTMMS